MRRVVRICVGVALCLAFATGCQPNDQVSFVNNSSHTVVIRLIGSSGSRFTAGGHPLSAQGGSTRFGIGSQCVTAGSYEAADLDGTIVKTFGPLCPGDTATVP